MTCDLCILFTEQNTVAQFFRKKTSNASLKMGGFSQSISMMLEISAYKSIGSYPSTV